MLTGNSSPQNDSVIRISVPDNDTSTQTNISCHFSSNSEDAADGTSIRWFLNGEEITEFDKESRNFSGLRFLVREDGDLGNVSSTLTLELVTGVAQDLLYLSNGNVTCTPPGPATGDVFGVFRISLNRSGQLTMLHV